MKSLLKSLGALALILATVAPAAVLADEHTSTAVPGVEVTIMNGGNAGVRGATVTAVSGSVVTASTAWGGTVLSWSVTTDSGTKFSGKAGNPIALSDVTVGDTVSFAGKLNSGSSLSVTASAVRDSSKGSDQITLSGSISSVGTTTLSFVLVRGTSTTTVQTNAATVFVLGSATSSFSSLAAGDMVKVTGTSNADHSLVTAAKITLIQKREPESKHFGTFIKDWFSKWRLFEKHSDR